MPDLFDLITRWWKQMLAIIILAVLVTGVIVFLKPKEYLSVVTAIPASSYTTDRSAIFNENIQGLYSALGTTDDLDMIEGTAQLDTVYLSVVDQFNLFDHYKIKKNDAARSKAAVELKGNTRVMKSGYGELKVKVWDTDKQLAPQLANAIMEKLNAIHQAVKNENNLAVLFNLKIGRQKMIAELDSLVNSIEFDSADVLVRSSNITQENVMSRGIRRNSLMDQLGTQEKLINEYQLMADSRNPVLIVVERARVAQKPDKPKLVYSISIAAVLSAIFSLLVALVLEKRKNAPAHDIAI